MRKTYSEVKRETKRCSANACKPISSGSFFMYSRLKGRCSVSFAMNSQKFLIGIRFKIILFLFSGQKGERTTETV